VSEPSEKPRICDFFGKTGNFAPNLLDFPLAARDDHRNVLIGFCPVFS
jgi:hypothetical protein